MTALFRRRALQARRPDWLALFEEGSNAFAEVVGGAQFGVDVDGGAQVAAEAFDWWLFPLFVLYLFPV
jgi:hypothetical protein